MFNILRNCIISPSHSNVEQFQFLPIFADICCLSLPFFFVCFLDRSHASECRVVSRHVLTFIWLMDNDVEHLFMCLLAIGKYFLEKYLYESFAHF